VPNPQEAVIAVIRRNDRFLVVRRSPQVVLPGYWTPLSGRIEPGETQAAAIVREVREEVGLRVIPLAKVWECLTDDGEFRLHWWTAELDEELAGAAEMVLAPSEVSDSRWVTAEEFLELRPTFVGDREFFERVLPGL